MIVSLFFSNTDTTFSVICFVKMLADFGILVSVVLSTLSCVLHDCAPARWCLFNRNTGLRCLVLLAIEITLCLLLFQSAKSLICRQIQIPEPLLFYGASLAIFPIYITSYVIDCIWLYRVFAFFSLRRCASPTAVREAENADPDAETEGKSEGDSSENPNEKGEAGK